MTDRQVLNLLAKEYPNADAVSAEIINLKAILCLPKGTEYFFSDVHGEADAFDYLLGTASGVIRNKIEMLFINSMAEDERALLARLIYRPRVVLNELGSIESDWYRVTIYRLVQVCKNVSSKYTRSKVRKKMPEQFAYVIDELLHADTEENKEKYYNAIIASIEETGLAEKFIIALCRLIRDSSIDVLHIIGDIYDRGAYPNLVIDELMRFTDIDIQWGNHDIHWMGAAAGNRACMANVLRVSIRYNNFDLLEDAYGINLRPLSEFAAETYKDDPCLQFQPRLLEENLYAPIDTDLASQMHKAIAIIQFKLEGQLIEKHPEYEMEHRLLFDKINYDDGTITINGKTYKMLDTNLPTVNPDDPLTLTADEELVVKNLMRCFTHSPELHRHIRFLYNVGSNYKIANSNLLFHGCIPTAKDGTLKEVEIKGKNVKGKEYMDTIDAIVRDAYYDPPGSETRENAGDFMWYLWCGPHSPIFGKSSMTTFERHFIKEKEAHKEHLNPYYDFVEDVDFCKKILREFGLDPEYSRIINGHVPVKIGENPIKANGLLYVIDGGISKSYQSTTGVGGYTLISNSHALALAEHRPFEEVKNANYQLPPTVSTAERYPSRIRVRQTDTGKALLQRIVQLEQLLTAYRDGEIREKYK